MMSSITFKWKELSEEYQKHLLGKSILNESEWEDLRWRRFGFYAFTLVLIVLGLPTWYVTTTPYRARFPYFGDQYRLYIQEFLRSQNITKTNADDFGSDIWLQATLSPRYNIHMTFVHDVAPLPYYDLETDKVPSKKNDGKLKRLSVRNNVKKMNLNSVRAKTDAILKGVLSFTQIFAESVQIELSTEHFFDFSLAKFLDSQRDFIANVKNRKKERLTDENKSTEKIALILETQGISALATEIDRLGTPPLTSSDPLIKIVVFMPNEDTNIEFLNGEQKNSDGLVVASWGGFVALNAQSYPPFAETLNAIFAILRLELGVSAARARVGTSPLLAQALVNCRGNEDHKRNCPEPKVDAISHKILATLEHLSRCVHLVDSLHDLATKLEDLVISNEVAKLADAAHKNFFIAYEQLIQRQRVDFDALASLRARLFAEAAITHPSLLEFLNFPSDQKIGIYLPLFFPTFVPFVMTLGAFIIFLMKRRLAVKKQQKDERNELVNSRSRE